MEELFKAIFRRWTEDELAECRDLVTGGFWPNLAKENASRPYITYAALPGSTEPTNTSMLELVPVQFTIYTAERHAIDGDARSGARLALQIRDRLVAGYDDVLLTLTEEDVEGASMVMVRAARQTPGHLLDDPDDNGFMMPVDYLFEYG